MDWSTVITAGVTGLGGFAVGWLSRPAAKAKVDEDTLKRQQRRKVIADARQMIADAVAKNLGKHALANDPRYLAIRSKLDDGVATPYAHLSLPVFTTPVLGTENHTPLIRNIDKLEREWDLL